MPGTEKSRELLYVDVNNNQGEGSGKVSLKKRELSATNNLQFKFFRSSLPQAPWSGFVGQEHLKLLLRKNSTYDKNSNSVQSG